MIIYSLLDTDLYKLSMMQAVYQNFPKVLARYEFICRTSDIDFSDCYNSIREEVGNLFELQFTKEEIGYLAEQGLFHQSFLDILRTFKLSPLHVFMDLDEGKLSISVRGPWWQTVMFEVPLLAIVNECYFRHKLPLGSQSRYDVYLEGQRRLSNKVELLNTCAPDNFRLMEFGTRRRFSRNWQEDTLLGLLGTRVRQGPDLFSMKEGCPVVGTSNVMLAKRYDIRPMGT